MHIARTIILISFAVALSHSAGPISVAADSAPDGISPDSHVTVSSISFAAAYEGDAVALVSNNRSKAGIAAIESSLKDEVMNLGRSGSGNFSDYGPSNMVNASLRVSQGRTCSTDVAMAVFFKGRTCKNGTLVVAASSRFKRGANLEVPDYGPMKWDSKSQMWFIKIRNIEANPGIVTVEGAECITQAEVVTLPFGCDAKLPYDLANEF
jgi:hypothetical protein